MDLKAVAPHVIKVNPAAIKPVSVTPETTAPVILAVVPGGPGAEGKSAYRLAVDAGFSGDEAAWLASLKGEDGDPGPANSLSIGTVDSGDTAAATITGDAPEQTLNLVLPKGADGTGGGLAELPPGSVRFRGKWDPTTNSPPLSASQPPSAPTVFDVVTTFGMPSIDWNAPTSIAVTPGSILPVYVADASGINMLGGATPLVPVSVTGVVALALNSAGHLFVASPTQVVQWDGTTETAVAVTVSEVRAMAFDANDVLYICDADRVITWNGTTQSVLAATGLDSPRGVIVDSGVVHIIDYGNSSVVRWNTATQTQTQSALGAKPLSLTIIGDALYVGVEGGEILWVGPDGSAFALNIEAQSPVSLSELNGSFLFIVDSGANTVTMVSAFYVSTEVGDAFVATATGASVLGPSYRSGDLTLLADPLPLRVDGGSLWDSTDIAIGWTASVSAGSNSVALGRAATASNSQSAAIGNSATTTRDFQVMLGAASAEVNIPGQLVLHSPNGTEYVIHVGDDGTLTATPL